MAVNRIKIGKRIYQYFKSRDIRGTPKRCTIKRDSIGDIYITIVADYVEPDLVRLMTGKIAGFDFGLKRFLTGSNGHDIESQSFSNGVSTQSNMPIVSIHGRKKVRAIIKELVSI